jgi:hypothetical protein
VVREILRKERATAIERRPCGDVLSIPGGENQRGNCVNLKVILASDQHPWLDIDLSPNNTIVVKN